MSDQKISREFAEQEFVRFTTAMDLDVDPSGMSDEDKAGMEGARRQFVKALQKGSLVINDEGLPEFTPQRSPNTEVLKFREPDGGMLMEIDRAKRNADVAKSFKVLAAITTTTPARFSQMKLADLNVCSAVLTLFLG